MPACRVAVLTDVHGNITSLEAVLADVERQVPDAIVFAGDLIMNGPRPAETLARIVQEHAPAVIGNTDAYVIDGSDPVAAWTKERIGPQGVAYLSALPLSYRLTPPGGASPQDDLLVVHSTPRDYDDLLLFRIPAFGTNFTRITPIEEARQMLAGARAGLIVYGHIHYFSEGAIDGQRVMSIGSVGFPFEGDRRAAYAIVHWDGDAWQVEPQRVEYDYESVARDIEKSGIPFTGRFARMIREASWFPRTGS